MLQGNRYIVGCEKRVEGNNLYSSRQSSDFEEVKG